jgi:DNA-binding transcriptional regulator YdaS (Cro superfamily)
MDLYEYLCRCRIDNRHFRDTHFAKELGITRDHLSRIKTGRSKVSVKLAKKIEILTSGQVNAWEFLNIEQEKENAL